MESRITIFNRQGAPLTEVPISASVVRNWLLNGMGQAFFEMARNDPNLTEELLRPWNPVLIEHDRAPAWGGVLMTSPPRQWGPASVVVSCQDPGFILKYRRTEPDLLLHAVTPGHAFAEMIRLTNSEEDTLIRANEIYGGDSGVSFQLGSALIYDKVAEIARQYGHEWTFEPDVSTGSLIFNANWYAKRGAAQQVQLEEGKNVELTTSPILLEQGVPISEVRTYVKSIVPGASFDDYRDEDARARYGLRQILQTASGPNHARNAGQPTVDAQKEPRRTYNLAALDVDNTFDNLGLGNVLPLILPDFGFIGGVVGTQTSVRILGMAFDDAVGKMELTTDESGIVQILT